MATQAAMSLFFLQVVVLLSTALVLGRLAVRAGLPAIVGELLAGVVLGPSVLGNLAPGVLAHLLPGGGSPALDGVTQLGVLLLVGLTAARLDYTVVGRRKAAAGCVTVISLICPLVIGLALGFLLPPVLAPPGGDRLPFAIFLGVVLAVSSVPVVAKAMADMNMLHREIPQLGLVVAVVHDAVGWLLLAVVSALAAANGTGLAPVAVAFAVLAAVAVLGRLLVRRLLTHVASAVEGGTAIALAVIVILSGAAIAHGLGLDATIGAFVGGSILVLPRVERQPDLTPLRTVVLAVFAPLFLAGAGLRTDLSALTGTGLLVAVGFLLVAIVAKGGGALLGAWLGGLTPWEGLALAAALNARGMVEIVVATVGLHLGVIDSTSFTVIVFVALVTSIMAPPLVKLAMRRMPETPEERRVLSSAR
jgi:Kef-type K+ transport system membrane component KefB